MAEPTQVEVLAWMERTGGSPADAVGHFWPDAEPGERARRRNTVKQWAYRARTSSPATTTPPPAAGPLPPAPSPPPAPPPPPALQTEPNAPPEEELPRVDYLRRQLARLEANLAEVERRKDFRVVAQLDKRISEVRAELDAALEPERRVLKLERTAVAAAAELERRARAIAIRAEIHRRNLERLATARRE